MLFCVRVVLQGGIFNANTAINVAVMMPTIPLVNPDSPLFECMCGKSYPDDFVNGVVDTIQREQLRMIVGVFSCPSDQVAAIGRVAARPAIGHFVSLFIDLVARWAGATGFSGTWRPCQRRRRLREVPILYAVLWPMRQYRVCTMREPAVVTCLPS